MNNIICLFLAVFCFGTIFSAVANPKNRAVQQTLSNKEFGSPDYDHDAFLGSDEAEEFSKLTPDESRRRLAIIAGKIDENSDGNVTETELQNWIQFIQQRYVKEETARQYKDYDSNADGKIDWKEYMMTRFGFIDDENAENLQHDAVNYTLFIERDKRKWKSADIDNDELLSIEEFRSFLHPEEFDHMKNIVALETLEDIDKNKDGFLTVDEYIQDMVSNEDGQEPEWLPEEKEHFSSYRDKNGDGMMDVKEVRDWIFPDEYDHVAAEAKHLIALADENKDQVLSIDEILQNHETFVGSQATNWGQALNRHDEF